MTLVERVAEWAPPHPAVTPSSTRSMPRACDSRLWAGDDDVGGGGGGARYAGLPRGKRRLQPSRASHRLSTVSRSSPDGGTSRNRHTDITAEVAARDSPGSPAADAQRRTVAPLSLWCDGAPVPTPQTHRGGRPWPSPPAYRSPRPGGRPATHDEPPVERSIEELMEIRMQDLPPMTRAELLALTDRDLPTLSDLLPLRMQDLPRVTRAELLALTDRDLPSINDLPPP